MNAKKGIVFFLAWLMFLVIGIIIFVFVVKVGVDIGKNVFNIQGVAKISFRELMSKANSLNDGDIKQHIVKLNKDNGIIFFNAGHSFVTMLAFRVPSMETGENLFVWEYFLRPLEGECSKPSQPCACFVEKMAPFENPDGFFTTYSDELKQNGILVNGNMRHSQSLVYSFGKYTCIPSYLFFAESQPADLSINVPDRASKSMSLYYHKQRFFVGGSLIYRSKKAESIYRSTNLFAERYYDTIRFCPEYPCFEESEKSIINYFIDLKDSLRSCANPGSNTACGFKDKNIRLIKEDVITKNYVINLETLPTGGGVYDTLRYEYSEDKKEEPAKYALLYQNYNAILSDPPLEPRLELVINYGLEQNNDWPCPISVANNGGACYNRISPEFRLNVKPCVENENLEANNRMLIPFEKLDETDYSHVFATTFRYSNPNSSEICFDLWYVTDDTSPRDTLSAPIENIFDDDSKRLLYFENFFPGKSFDTIANAGKVYTESSTN